MKKIFSTRWKSSKQRRKQRKYRANALMHIKRKFLASNLTKFLREKYKIRSIPLRIGDVVKIMRGQFKGKEAKVERLNVREGKVYLDKIRITKRDGAEVAVPINASNLSVVSLNLEDKLRMGREKKKLKAQAQKIQPGTKLKSNT